MSHTFVVFKELFLGRVPEVPAEVAVKLVENKLFVLYMYINNVGVYKTMQGRIRLFTEKFAYRAVLDLSEVSMDGAYLSNDDYLFYRTLFDHLNTKVKWSDVFIDKAEEGRVLVTTMPIMELTA